MYVPFFFCFGIGKVIYGVTEYVEDTSQSFFTDGNAYGRASIKSICTSLKTVRRSHSDTSCGVIAYVLCNLNGKRAVLHRNSKGVVYLRQFAFFELNIDYRAHYLKDFAYILFIQLIHLL